MNKLTKISKEFSENGFGIINEMYADEEINSIIAQIAKADTSKDTFRKSEDLFAIRQFLKEVPAVFTTLFNTQLRKLISQVMGSDFFVVKSIYFDKPSSSNWYVPYHQDLTISVDRKIALENFTAWTHKQNQFAVQPPIEILENIVTLRIHLDDTDENNGALQVIPRSHLNKIYQPSTIDWTKETATNCCVKKGGVMLMKPLLLHSSNRTTNQQQRRVIHIEFSNCNLPEGLAWAEKMEF